MPLLLAVQDSYINVQAAGAIDLGGIYQPTRLRFDLTRNLKPETTTQADAANTLPSAIGAFFDSYAPNSGVALSSQSGSIAVNSLLQSPGNGDGYTDTLFAHTQNYSWGRDGYGYSLIAPNLSVTALTGSIQLANGSPYDSVLLYPSATGELSLVAGGSILGSRHAGFRHLRRQSHARRLRKLTRRVGADARQPAGGTHVAAACR